uniref:Uncharacterized protein n=1 Tax=Anguilla anguilla TaxID=7936 RepID=A0A0E9V5X0_ANGAN
MLIEMHLVISWLVIDDIILLHLAQLHKHQTLKYISASLVRSTFCLGAL